MLSIFNYQGKANQNHMKHYHTSVRVTNVEKARENQIWEQCEERDFHTLRVEIYLGTSIRKGSMGFPKKLKEKRSHDSLYLAPRVEFYTHTTTSASTSTQITLKCRILIYLAISQCVTTSLYMNIPKKSHYIY